MTKESNKEDKQKSGFGFFKPIRDWLNPPMVHMPNDNRNPSNGGGFNAYNIGGGPSNSNFNVNPPYPPQYAPYYPSLPYNQAPSLPFSHPPPLPGPYGSNPIAPPQSYATGTLVNHQVSPLDSVPFEAKLTLSNSTNLVSLDQLFKEIKKAADVVDRADAYLRSSQSDYDFKTEQGLIYH